MPEIKKTDFGLQHGGFRRPSVHRRGDGWAEVRSPHGLHSSFQIPGRRMISIHRKIGASKELSRKEREAEERENGIGAAGDEDEDEDMDTLR